MSNFTQSYNELKQSILDTIKSKVKTKPINLESLNLFTVWNAGFDEVEEIQVIALSKINKEVKILVEFCEGGNRQHTKLEFINLESLAKIADYL